MSSSHALLKEDLRRQALAQRLQIRPDLQDVDKITRLIMLHLCPEEGSCVAGYWPIRGEFDVRPILQALRADGIVNALPHIPQAAQCHEEADRILDFVRLDEVSKLRPGPLGTQEIVPPHISVRPDIVLVPLLAFDRNGTRLGYGGGYYDATLRDLRQNGEVVSVGIAYDAQLCLFSLPAEPHDIPLDWVITPTQAYRFAG